MRTEIRLGVLHVVSLLLLVLATVTILQSLWMLLAFTVVALLASSFYAHRYVDELLDGGYPRHGDQMD